MEPDCCSPLLLTLVNVARRPGDGGAETSAPMFPPALHPSGGQTDAKQTPKEVFCKCMRRAALSLPVPPSLSPPPIRENKSPAEFCSVHSGSNPPPLLSIPTRQTDETGDHAILGRWWREVGVGCAEPSLPARVSHRCRRRASAVFRRSGLESRSDPLVWRGAGTFGHVRAPSLAEVMKQSFSFCFFCGEREAERRNGTHQKLNLIHIVVVITRVCVCVCVHELFPTRPLPGCLFPVWRLCVPGINHHLCVVSTAAACLLVVSANTYYGHLK